MKILKITKEVYDQLIPTKYGASRQYLVGTNVRRNIITKAIALKKTSGCDNTAGISVRILTQAYIAMQKLGYRCIGVINVIEYHPNILYRIFYRKNAGVQFLHLQIKSI